jgi:hypothetical protein
MWLYPARSTSALSRTDAAPDEDAAPDSSDDASLTDVWATTDDTIPSSVDRDVISGMGDNGRDFGIGFVPSALRTQQAPCEAPSAGLMNSPRSFAPSVTYLNELIDWLDAR